LPIPLNCALQKLKRCLAIPPFRGKNFKHLAFVVDSTPQIMRLAIYLHEYLVQVPAPVRIPTVMNAPFPDLRGIHRSEPVPPETHRLTADVDATFEQQVGNLMN
jgi:hypothetical protein